MKSIVLLIPLFVLSTSALAECNFKKATRNKMLDQKIGISGHCDTKNALKTQAEKQVDDMLNNDLHKVKQDSIEKKEKIEKKAKTTQKIIDSVK